jgi:hypothetical protein
LGDSCSYLWFQNWCLFCSCCCCFNHHSQYRFLWFSSVVFCVVWNWRVWESLLVILGFVFDEDSVIKMDLFSWGRSHPETQKTICIAIERWRRTDIHSTLSRWGSHCSFSCSFWCLASSLSLGVRHPFGFLTSSPSCNSPIALLALTLLLSSFQENKEPLMTSIAGKRHCKETREQQFRSISSSVIQTFVCVFLSLKTLKKARRIASRMRHKWWKGNQRSWCTPSFRRLVTSDSLFCFYSFTREDKTW